MKVTLDTNVLVAAFISRGVCHDLFEHLIRQHHVMSSEFILAEFRRVLVEKIRVPIAKVDAAEKLIRARVMLVTDVALDERASRDPDDDWILSVAESSESDCLVTGDDDLLSLGDFQGIPILRPGVFWEFETRVSGDV